MNDTTTDIVDRIDDLVDAQLAQEASGYDHNLAQARCPHCGRDWHGLAITERLEEMRADYRMRQHLQGLSGGIGEHGYAESVVDPDYRYTEDESPVLCPGSAFIGPRRPTPGELFWQRTSDPWGWRLNRMYGSLDPLIGRPSPFATTWLMDITEGDRVGYDSGDGVVHVHEVTAEEAAQIRYAAAPPLFSDGEALRIGADFVRTYAIFPRRGGRLAEFLGAVEGQPYVWGGDGSVIDEGRQTAAPDPDPEPAPSDGRPPVPRPSHRPPMWANSPQSQRRNRRGGRP